MSKILLLESDQLLAKNILAALSGNYNIDWCRQPQAAVNSADNHLPDLVIMDLMLTFHSGLEFLYEFRSYADWARVPVIVFSSIPAEEVNLDCNAFAQLGICKFLPKNHTSLSELTKAIDETLQLALT